jgi:hypothetical protein
VSYYPKFFHVHEHPKQQHVLRIILLRFITPVTTFHLFHGNVLNSFFIWWSFFYPASFGLWGGYARATYIYPSDFCNQNFSKAFLTKENHCLKMKRDDSLKKYPSINPVSVVPSQGYPEFKLPAFSVWVAGVSLDTWNHQKSNHHLTRKWLIAIFFSGGDWRLFGGKRTSLDGYQLWVNAAC